MSGAYYKERVVVNKKNPIMWDFYFVSHIIGLSSSAPLSNNNFLIFL